MERADLTGRRDELLLFLVGHNLMLLNYVLVRQMTASFADIETAALLMALAYFSGVSVGYYRPERFAGRLVIRLLPGFLALQTALFAVGPLVARTLAREAGDVAAYAVVFALVALGSTSLYAVFLPNLIGDRGERTGRLYAAETAGSLVAIVVAIVLSRFGQAPVYAVYFASFVGLGALAGAGAPALAAMSALGGGYVLGHGAIDRTVAEAVYRAEINGSRPVQVLLSRTSPYHKIEVIDAEGQGRMLLLDGRVQFAPAWHDDYSYFAAEYPARLLGRPDACVLGCGSMSTVGRIGGVAASIHIVDLDEGVFETSKTFFGPWNRLDELHHWSFEADDAKHFLATTSAVFELIIDDIPPARSRQIALTYTREFFALVRQRLSPRGIFSMPSLVSVTSKRSRYGRRILATLADVFDRVYVLTAHGSSYCFAVGPGLSFDGETLRAAIDHPDAAAVQILLPEEVRQRVEGVGVITIDNMADLIHE